MSRRSFVLARNEPEKHAPDDAHAKPTILVLAQHYLPSERAGGGLRTIVNMIERLSDEFRFRVITTDRDIGDSTPYTSVTIDAWNQTGPAEVFYASPRRLGLGGLRRVVRESRSDVVYLNSFFSPIGAKYLFLRRVGLVQRRPMIVAPEGELAPDALNQKRTKKRLYRLTANFMGLYRDVLWKASTDYEATAIRQHVSVTREIRMAPNMSPLPHEIIRAADPRKPRKRPGELQLVFLSRIVLIKNLKWVLESIAGLSGRVVLDVYGPTEDQHYWAVCCELIRQMPSNISVNYCGAVPARQVPETFARYQFMILPTLGESFGHVVIEALAAGSPVIISNRTPWLNLQEKNIGWDLPLEDSTAWQDILQNCVAMDNVRYQAMSESAQRFASEWLRAPEIQEQTAAVLREALEARRTNSA